jgi:uncharacterized protein
MSDKIIQLLKDDKEYYGGVGKKYLSNSDIGALISNPREYGAQKEDNVNFAKGRLFHHFILEPEKVQDWNVIDVSSRNTNKYKDILAESGESFLLLQKEYNEIKNLARVMTANLDFYDMIYAKGNRFEVPNIGEIGGVMWKGKADIVCEDCLIDIKTTGDINKFMYSARMYNYDSQAYVYHTLFGKPLKFLVICKTTGQLGLFETTTDFIEKGAEKVQKAIEVYNQFFGKDATDNVNQYYRHVQLL